MHLNEWLGLTTQQGSKSLAHPPLPLSPTSYHPRRLDRAIQFAGSRDSGAILSRLQFAIGKGGEEVTRSRRDPGDAQPSPL
eukprot:10852142-Alexandrium_andersonii.AAC.1